MYPTIASRSIRDARSGDFDPHALFELAGAMVQSISKAAEKMNTMDLEAARVEALGEIKPSLKEAKAFGPLGGSSAFRDAVVSYGDWMVNQLEGPIKEYAEVTKTGSVTAEQAEHLKSLGEAFTNEGGSKAAALQSARGQFMSDWHFEGYMAWQDTKKKKK